MKKNIANITTLARIFLIPSIMSFFLVDKLHMATFLFSVAAITDGLDGYLARYFNKTSSLGAWLDPVADKLLVISILLLFLADKFSLFFIPTVIIICREVVVSSLREWMATLGKQNALKVSMLGKWKTSLQMLALFLFLLSKPRPEWTALLLTAYGILYLATLLTLVSLIDYLWSAWKVTADSRN